MDKIDVLQQPINIKKYCFLSGRNASLIVLIAVEGTCDDLGSGDIDITIWAGICQGHSKKGKCFFGWNSYQHMLISETFAEREIIEYS